MADAHADDRDALVEVAGAVADRTPVNWEGEQSRTPERLAALERLREIAALQAAIGHAGEAAPAGVLFTWGPLQALQRIGEGSFAEVYRAWDTTLQREVALKLRRADLDVPALGARRWIEEARRLARVRHPHVLAILGADEHEGRVGIWTELIHGSTLEQWIVAQGALGAREAAGVGIDLCGALAAVHATGLLHGDVTTRNVMREGRAGAADRSGRIVLMDFGSAQDARAGDLIAFGTPLFMAPEVLAGEAPDARSDVYSLGVVLYRLLTVRYPIEPGSLEEMRTRLERGERTALRTARPDLPSALVEAIERACEPDRGQRFGDPAELERALSQAIAGSDGPVAGTAVRGRAHSWVGLVGVAAAVAIAAAVLLVRDPWHVRGLPVATLGAAGDSTESSVVTPAPTHAAAPTALAAAVEPAAPELDATLYRVTAGAREAMRTGDLVAPGDELALEVQTRERVHLYVLSEDEAGAVFVLFPLVGRGVQNPLPAGAAQRLPGREGAEELSWQVTSAGGRETFLVLASRTPLEPVAAAVAGIPQASPDAPVTYRTLPPDALARLRGVGSVVARTPLRDSAPSRILPGLARDLARLPQGRAIWMRLLVLENPAP